MTGTISRAILYTLYALSIAGLFAGIVAAIHPEILT